jgi:predicted ATPase
VVVAQVEGLAARQPVMMLFEDAHWSDPTSLELLDLIIDRVPALPILLIVTFRPEFAPPWVGRPHVTSLGLNRLAPRQRAEMIAGLTGGKALPQEIADQIIDRTDGVPLFVEELTKAVVESGMLTNIGDRYTAAVPVAPLAIPASLQASLLARLDRLAPVREVAQIGAALGRQFSHELIAAVAVMPPPQLDDALAQLVGAELIYRRGAPPDAEYTFKHALVQDAAYGTLLRSRRQQLHARIAATLEDRFPDIVAAQPAQLARHCTGAGLTEKAIAYWLAAGQHALGKSMLAEAVALLRRGLALVPGVPDGDCTPPDAEYTFKHALVQDAAYSTLLRDRRRQLHAHIAATLEGRFPEIVAAQPALLAQHCMEAGLVEKALAYWLSAGRQAWGRSMLAEAVALLRRGLALVPDLPDGDWRREREFDLQIALAQALVASRGWSAPELAEVYPRARKIASTLNRPRALLVALYGEWLMI